MLRSIIWYISFFGGLLASIPAMIRVKSLEKRGLLEKRDELINKVTKVWANVLLKIAGAKVNVHGLENIPSDGNFLFVGNHQGNFDIPIYVTKIPMLKGFVAKVELQKIPGITVWMKNLNCIFMDRNNMRKSGEAIITGIKTLKSGKSLVIFPEGTRSKGDKMGEFKAGSFKLATKSKVPIIPVTMDGSYKLMEKNSKKWLMTPATVNLYIHKPIYTASLSKEELDALPETVYNIVKSKLPNN